jgi:hydrogenase maturation protease
VKTAHTTVIGIGNLIMSDDGVGVHAIHALRQRFTLSAGRASFPTEVVLIDGGTKSLDLLPYIEETERLMLIDAVDMKAAPGTIKLIEGRSMRAFLDVKFSVHQISIPDMLFAAEFKGITPPEMCLVGIQPLSLEVSDTLSPPVAGRFEEFLGTILTRLGQWDVVPEPIAESTAAERN